MMQFNQQRVCISNKKNDRFIVLLVMFFLCAFCLFSVRVNAADNALESFFSRVQSYKADFTQTVTDEDGEVIEQSQGTLTFQRPGKFFWSYHQPLPQQIISDGQRIWLYDEDLEQVTVRNYQAAISGTPAELLAGDANIIDYYTVSNDDHPSEFRLTLNGDDDSGNQFSEVIIRFDQNNLISMVLKDSFLRTTTLDFANDEENLSIDPSFFHFIIPSGVDVIKNH